MRRYLITLLLTFSLTANLAQTEVEPSAIVNNCVNTITGRYSTYKNDLTVHAIQPITISRLFSRPKKGDAIGRHGGWQWFIYTSAYADYTKQGNYIRLYDTNGSFLEFKPAKDRWIPSKKLLEKACCNTSRGEISAQNDIANYYITHPKEKIGFTLHCPDGSTRYYRPTTSNMGKRTFILDTITHPNTNITTFTYHEKFWDRPALQSRYFQYTNGLERIETTNAKKNKTYAWIKFNYESSPKKNPNFIIRTSQDQWVSYTFHSLKSLNHQLWKKFHKPEIFLLTDISCSDTPGKHISYSFENHKIDPLIRKIDERTGRGHQIDYYDKSGLNKINDTTVKIDGSKDIRYGLIKRLEIPRLQNGGYATCQHPVSNNDDLSDIIMDIVEYDAIIAGLTCSVLSKSSIQKDQL